MSTAFSHKNKPMMEEGFEGKDTPAKEKAGPARETAIQACNLPWAREHHRALEH